VSEEPPIDTAVVDDPAPEESIPSLHRRRRIVLEWVAIVVVALVVSLVMRTFVVQTFYIPSASMEPTLQIGDRIIVSKLSVDLGTINRGDIIVFKAPSSEHCGDAVSDLVKRVIGVPGDRLRSRGPETILVNGKVLHENWPHFEPLLTPIKPITVPANSYFVMGDNHPNSCDSRYWGTVPRANVVGKVFFRIWPLGRFGFL
jgi:signal peptidase I